MIYALTIAVLLAGSCVAAYFLVRYGEARHKRAVAVERARIEREIDAPLETDPETIAAEWARYRKEGGQ